MKHTNLPKLQSARWDSASRSESVQHSVTTYGTRRHQNVSMCAGESDWQMPPRQFIDFFSECGIVLRYILGVLIYGIDNQTQDVSDTGC